MPSISKQYIVYRLCCYTIGDDIYHISKSVSTESKQFLKVLLVSMNGLN